MNRQRPTGSVQKDSSDQQLQAVRSPLHDIAESARRPPAPANDQPLQDASPPTCSQNSDVSLGRGTRVGRQRSQSRGRANSEGRSLAGAPPPRVSRAGVSKGIALPIVVSIPRTESDNGMLATKTLYVVEASGFGVTGRTRHPFEDFEALHASISSKIDFALPPMPASTWFGNNRDTVVEERRGKLESLLGKMLMLQGAVDDSEELLWRFLNLPRPAVVAARFLACQPEHRGLWLSRVWETSAEAKGGNVPLQHPVVEKQLVELARCAVDENDKLTEQAIAHLSDISVACELLARIFSSRDTNRPADFGKEPERHECIPVLLTLCRVEVPDLKAMRKSSSEDLDRATPQSLPLREAASKALRMLAQTGQWKDILCAFLANGGTSHLLATASLGSSGSDLGDAVMLERLVAELILRGFAGPVPQQFASPDATKERKQLLNTLFVSSDDCVRIMVGLILSALLCEETFKEVGQAEAGLQNLCEELLPAKLAQVAIVLLLLEDNIWKWLCNLVAAPRSIVSGFALLVVTHTKPNPDLVFETEGFHDALVALTSPEADPQCRDLASKILLSAYRGGARLLPPDDVIVNMCDALAINADAVLQHNVEEHKVHDASIEQVSEWTSSTLAVEEEFKAACDSVEAFNSRAEEWKNAVQSAATASNETKEVQARLKDALGQQWQSMTENTARLANRNGPHEDEEDLNIALQVRQEQLASQEEELRQMEERVSQLGEERMAYTKSLADQDEAARQFEAEIEKAEAHEREAAAQGDDVPADLAEYLDNIRARRQETIERINVMRAEAAVLDEQLQESTEGLPEWRKALAHERQCVDEMVAQSQGIMSPSTDLDNWATWLDRQRLCQEELVRVQQSIESAGNCIKSASRERHQLRITIAQLRESLASLDGCLASLESADESFVE